MTEPEDEEQAPDDEELLLLLVIAAEPPLPGISAARYREELRSTFVIVCCPVIMFAFVLGLWGPWLTGFLLAIATTLVGLATAKRAQRLRALRERGELE